MVYIGNIIKAHSNLSDDEEIVLKYDGGDGATTILHDDKLEKQNGDLKIIRNRLNCAVIVDCAEVKYMIIHERWL